MKHLKRILIIMMFFMIGMVGKVTIVGYVNYAYILNDIGLEKTIDAIMDKEDYVTVNNISDTLLTAVVATEDKRFYTHDGVDYISLSRALLINIKSMSYKTGGSTITQQLAKNLFLSFDKTLERKVTEYFLARKIETIYDKDEILAVYLNVINYGEGCFGISAASVHYFNKLPINLSDAESVLLSGLPQSPVNLSLSKYYGNAIVRSEVVLASMVNNKAIEEEVADQIIAEIKEGIN